MKEGRQKKRVHTEWFHIYIMYKPRPRKLSYSDEKPAMVAWGNGRVWGGAGGKDYTKAWGNFWRWRYVHHLDFDGDFLGVRVRQNVSDCIPQKCVAHYTSAISKTLFKVFFVYLVSALLTLLPRATDCIIIMPKYISSYSPHIYF